MSATCACGTSLDLQSNGSCPTCGQQRQAPPTLSAEPQARVPRQRGLALAYLAAVVCFFAIIPITAAVGVLDDGLGSDWLWKRLLIMMVVAFLSVPAIVMGIMSLARIRRLGPGIGGREIAIGAIVAGALSLGEEGLLTAFALPFVQRETDRSYG